jgi:transforming growth factor-beta-induced protein
VNKITIITLLAGLILAGFGFMGTAKPIAAQTETSQTVMNVIRGNDQLQDFETLIDAVGLADNLEQDGPFTIFAPTNAALANLDVQVANTEATLTEILLYHVVNGRYNGPAVANRSMLPTLLGEEMRVRVQSGEINLDDTVTITTTDLKATNGVVHIVDTILLPPVNSLITADNGSRVDTLNKVLAEDGRFTTFLSLLDSANLDIDLDNPALTYTIFAPTDAAFEKLSDEQMNNLMADPEALETILSYHLIGDMLGINQIATDDYIPTLEGRPLIVTTNNSQQVFINGEQLTTFNIVAANGVVHAVDTVLMP